MEELPLVRLAHREEICLTLEKGPEGMGLLAHSLYCYLPGRLRHLSN